MPRYVCVCVAVYALFSCTAIPINDRNIVPRPAIVYDLYMNIYEYI